MIRGRQFVSFGGGCHVREQFDRHASMQSVDAGPTHFFDWNRMDFSTLLSILEAENLDRILQPSLLVEQGEHNNMTVVSHT